MSIGLRFERMTDEFKEQVNFISLVAPPEEILVLELSFIREEFVKILLDYLVAQQITLELINFTCCLTDVQEHKD